MEYPQQAQEETIDIKKYIYLIAKNWYWFVASVLICMVAAYLVNRYTENVYSVNGTLIVRDDENARSLGGAENFMQSLRLLQQTRSVQNEIGILQTYTLARRAINRLPEFKITYVGVGRSRIREDQLYTRCPFYIELDTTYKNPTEVKVHIYFSNPNEYLIDTEYMGGFKRKVRIGDKVSFGDFGFTLHWRDTSSYNEGLRRVHYYFIVNDLHRLAKTYQSKVQVILNDKKGSILTLSTQGFVAQQEADYLNALMEEYIYFGLESKNRIAENTIRFIDEQLYGITDSLRKAELQLQNFRSKNMIIDISQEGSALYDRVQSYQTEKNLIAIRDKYLDYLYEYVIGKKEIKDIISPTIIGISDPTLNKLIGDLSQLYVEKEILQLSVTSNNPSLDIADAKIQKTRQLILETIKSLKNSNKLAVKDINDRTQNLDAQISKLPKSERELISIKRDFTLLDKLFTYLSEKKAEAGIAKASNISDSKILDRALPENAKPERPRKKVNYMIGFVLGLFVPFIVILIRDYLNDTIQEKKDIESKTTVPIFGGIGHFEGESELPVFDNPKSSMAESFRALRTNLQFILSDSPTKVIALTSTTSGEGKTFCSANLSAIISMSNKRTLLIGMDLRKPRLSRLFNLEGKNTGVSTYLSGTGSIDEIIKPTNIPNLFIVPSGPIPPNPAELIETPRMAEFIEEAKKRFDFIIIDTPPVAVVTDALLLAPYVDTFLFVIRQNYSSKGVVGLIDELHHKRNLKHAGILINDVRVEGYYGSYKYQYGYYGYGYSYAAYGQGYYSDDNKVKKSFLQKLLTHIGSF